MRPPLSWSDLRGRTVGVWGLGLEGKANVEMLHRLGVTPVVVEDEAALAGGGLGQLLRCDVVVKSPGISRYRPEARDMVDHGVLLVGGLGLWLCGVPLSRVVVVTGTKGKSTTAAILGHLLTAMGAHTFVGGNIGTVPYAGARIEESYEYWVIEVSSYQATDLPVSPPVVAVTSLHPDHLPWHDNDVETYFRDKLSAATQPGAQWTIANGDDPLLRARRSQLGPSVRWVPDERSPSPDWSAALGLPGRHNAHNAEIARACAEQLGFAAATDVDALRAAARGFVPLPSRLTVIASIGGVDFVDDSLSTNVLPTLAALDAFAGRRIALIVGGAERNIDYTPLVEGVAARTDLRVLTVPDNGPRIAAAIGDRSPVEQCGDLRAAVAKGYEFARPSGVVLLSPAAPSFGQFRDYRDRSATFAALVRELSDLTT